MSNNFHVLEAKKLKNGGIHYRGLLTVIADYRLKGDDDNDDGDDGGGGGGGGGDWNPPHDIKIPDLHRDVKWIYADGTPDWAIAAALKVEHDIVHIDDL